MEIVADGVSSGGLMQTKLSVTVDRNVDLCSPQQSVLSFVFFCSPKSLKLVITWVMTLLIGALVSCACLSFVFVVHSFFRVCIACTVCAAVRDYRARLLHTITVLFHTQTCQQGLSGQAAEAPFVSSQSSSETEVQHSVSIKSTVTGDTSRINAASERCVVMSVLWLAMTILQTFVERGVYVRQGSIETELSTVKFASSQGVGNVEVSIVQGLNSRSLCFGCGVSKEGQQLVREHVDVLPDAGSNMTRQQSLSTPSMPAQTETGEHVRGKKALKKHLQRSIDKLVAAKEQLPEEEWREVAQGITDRIKGLQLQKDGIMSLAARRKKAFAQLEESEKTLESKRKALQQAQEALEEASRKHAAAQEACASLEQEIEEEEDQDEEMRRGPEQHKGSLPRLVQLVRLYFTVKRVKRDAHNHLADLRHSCTSAKKLFPLLLWKLVRR